MQRFEALFNHATMGIVIADQKGAIVAANPFALRLFGYSADEVIGKAVEMLIPSRYHQRHVHNREGYARSPHNRPMGVGMDLFGIKKDGTEFPVEVSLSNYMQDGEQNILAFISDISIRKKAEAEIIKLNNDLESTVEQRTKDLTNTLKELEDAKKKVEDVLSYQKALFDNAGVMIIATDEKGRIKMFNPESSRMLGYSEMELLDSNSIIMLLDPADITRKREELQKEFGIQLEDGFSVLVEKSRRNAHEEHEYTMVRKDGSTFPVSTTTTAIRDSSGKVTGYLGISVDISERKKAEMELWAALEKAKELSELKSRFVSMASHEFRTPLSTILSSTFLIRKYTGSDDNEKREKHTQRIISSVNLLTDILNDFLSVGRIEEGRIEVRPSEFFIDDLVNEIIDEMKGNLRSGQSIDYDHRGAREVRLDPSMLKHIVMNLVSNAVKFSPAESCIDVETVCEPGSIAVSVSDQGMGISEEDQRHLAERFFRGSNASTIQGTGLGLHIVSKYAELMNGAVSCISELGRGTRFIVTFQTDNNQ